MAAMTAEAKDNKVTSSVVASEFISEEKLFASALAMALGAGSK